MPRKTRAALRAEQIHIDQNSAADASATLFSCTPKVTRTPLEDIVPNCIERAITEPATTDRREDMAVAKKGKAKAKKGKSTRKEEIDKTGDTEYPESKPIPESAETARLSDVSEEERVVASPVISDMAVQDLNKKRADNTSVQRIGEPEHQDPASSKVSRMSKSQLAKTDDEVPERRSEEPALQSASGSPTAVELPTNGTPKAKEANEVHTDNNTAEVCTPAEQTFRSTPSVQSSHLESEARSEPSVSSENVKEISQTQTTIGTEPKLLENSVIQPEDPIEALDALEDAIEEVDRALPSMGTPVSSEKRRQSKHAVIGGVPRISMTAKSLRTTPLSVKKVISAATRPLVIAKRVPSSVSNGTLARSSTAHVSSVQSCTDRSSTSEKANTTGDYLASRRRPIHLSFPTPPPPPRSAKPPTMSTFQLPGDAVAAKLKAAREERLKRGEESTQKSRDLRARPVRKSTVPVTVKQTAASRARESLIHGLKMAEKRKNSLGNNTVKPLGRSTPPSKQKQSPTRSEYVSVIPRKTAMVPALVKEHSGELKKAPAAGSSTVHISRSNVSVERPFSAETSRIDPPQSTGSSSGLAKFGPVTKSTVIAADITTQRLRAKQIFNRDTVKQEEREQLRKEKGETAKKARAQAAERGRQASRDWAEKQRARVTGAATTVRGGSRV